MSLRSLNSEKPSQYPSRRISSALISYGLHHRQVCGLILSPRVIASAAALFQSRDIDELFEALTEDAPNGRAEPDKRITRLPPRLRVIDGGRA